MSGCFVYRAFPLSREEGGEIGVALDRLYVSADPYSARGIYHNSHGQENTQWFDTITSCLKRVQRESVSVHGVG